MYRRSIGRLAVVMTALATAAAGPAAAQTMSTNSASFNGGYGRYNGQENRPIENYSNRDANGNMMIIDGIIQAGSSYASSEAKSSSYSGGVGAGSSSATAIGNNLNVVTQGNFNTVIVNSTQINNGNVTAGAKTGGSTNGQ
jgi:holdfast attachment protein HfaA